MTLIPFLCRHFAVSGTFFSWKCDFSSIYYLWRLFPDVWNQKRKLSRVLGSLRDADGDEV